jgi:hypothetical protein
MTPDDLAELQTRIETALADSAKEFGTDDRPDDRAATYVLPFEMACHLVNHDDTRAVLTDAAVRRLGGRTFSVAIENDVQITIGAGVVAHDLGLPGKAPLKAAFLKGDSGAIEA